MPDLKFGGAPVNESASSAARGSDASTGVAPETSVGPHTTQQTGHEAEVLTPGSFVIERYVYTRANASKGVQWIVHRVSASGGLDQLTALDTRREAARFIEEHRG